MEDYDYEQQQEYVNVYRDRERAGGYREVMGTEMDMAKRYGKDYERLNRMMKRMEPEDKIITQLENYYFHVDSIQHLPVDSLKRLIDAFRRVPRNIYKNPHMFLLGWVYSLYGLNTVKHLIKETNQLEIADTDVIRYYRLYQSVLSS